MKRIHSRDFVSDQLEAAVRSANRGLSVRKRAERGQESSIAHVGHNGAELTGLADACGVEDEVRRSSRAVTR